MYVRARVWGKADTRTSLERRFTWGHARYHRGRLRRRHAHTRVIPHRQFGSRNKWGRIIILVGKKLVRSHQECGKSLISVFGANSGGY